MATTSRQTRLLIRNILEHIKTAKINGEGSVFYMYWLGVARGRIWSSYEKAEVSLIVLDRLNKLTHNLAFSKRTLP